MLERAQDLAEARAEVLKAEALEAARHELDAEHARLVALHAVNPSIKDEEVDAIATERDALLAAIPEARLRLDAVRFVVSPDFLALR
jgi:ATP-dependent helicase HepA